MPLTAARRRVNHALRKRLVAIHGPWMGSGQLLEQFVMLVARRMAAALSTSERERVWIRILLARWLRCLLPC